MYWRPGLSFVTSSALGRGAGGRGARDVQTCVLVGVVWKERGSCPEVGSKETRTRVLAYTLHYMLDFGPVPDLSASLSPLIVTPGESVRV